MKLYSTNDKTHIVGLKEAIWNPLPKDNGLYLPFYIPRLDARFINNLPQYSFQEIAFIICASFFGDEMKAQELMQIVNKAIDFPAPLVEIEANISCLELFHGPSMAFKDFGARFMSQLMHYYNREETEKSTILVATSGDTGGAVAAGFHKTPDVEVIILYPSGRVSSLQEKQLTSLGDNIFACEVKGSFDDCQAMVKAAFHDDSLKQNYRLSSANSINIARLLPQSFYYFEAMKQLDQRDNVCFSVPSGNFGNLSAGVIAKKLGLNVKQFIAASNANRVFLDFLISGNYVPKASLHTISNAMDVGDPSNFVRLLDLYESNYYDIKKEISSYSFSDEETKEGLRALYKTNGYLCDPHGAIGYLAAKKHLEQNPDDHVIFLETAHPAKFSDIVEEIVSSKIKIPAALLELMNREKHSTVLEADYNALKQYLLDRV